MLDKYTIILRGELFTLYGDQIEFDAPNYFTSLFLGDFAESQTRVVELSRSPVLFRILVEYMSGYEVLPLQPASVPPTMSLEMALLNLERDAEFYGFQRLPSRIKGEAAMRGPAIDARAFGHSRITVSFTDVLEDRLPRGVTLDARGVGTIVHGEWIPVTIRASGALLSAQHMDCVGEYTFQLTDPELHHALRKRIHQQDPVLGASPLSSFVDDSRLLHALPCTAHKCTTVRFGKNHGQASASWLNFHANVGFILGGNYVAKNPVYAHLKQAYDLEGGFIVWADEVVFAIVRHQFGQADRQVQCLAAKILSAVLVPRTVVPRHMLQA